MDDDTLIALLRDAALRHDPVPASALAVARGAIAWRDVDAELAELLSDSAVDADALAGVRSASIPRLLVFEAGELELELELDESGDPVRAIGQIAPPGPAVVRVETPAGDGASAQADRVGRFAIAVPAGPFRLRIEREGEEPVVTPTIAA